MAIRTITTNAISEKYGVKGEALRRLCIKLQYLKVLGSRISRGSRTFEQNGDLPPDLSSIMFAYNMQFVQAVDQVCEDAMSELADLRDDLVSWRDGMSGTGLENTSKYEEVDEAANALEGVDLESYDVPDEVSEIMVEARPAYDDRLEQSMSRDKRLANAVAWLTAIHDELDGNPNIEDESGEVRVWLDEVQQAVDDLEGVTIPGMF